VHDIKAKLIVHCRQYLSQRIVTAENAIREAQEAANDETKSSAGDKYETGRAMMQIEIEKNMTQLQETLKLRNTLDQIKNDAKPAEIRLGSLVITNEGNFFLAISVGKLVVDEKAFFLVSRESPIGSRLMGLKANESFTFNNKAYKIEQVW
jgi:transcription elongation GreA/GreB family factor